MCQLWALHVVTKRQFFYIYEQTQQLPRPSKYYETNVKIKTRNQHQ